MPPSECGDDIKTNMTHDSMGTSDKQQSCNLCSLGKEACNFTNRLSMKVLLPDWIYNGTKKLSFYSCQQENSFLWGLITN